MMHGSHLSLTSSTIFTFFLKPFCCSHCQEIFRINNLRRMHVNSVGQWNGRLAERRCLSIFFLSIFVFNNFCFNQFLCLSISMFINFWSSRNSSMVSTATCYQGGPGFKSQQGREFINFWIKRKFNNSNLNTIIVWVHELTGLV